MAAMSLVATDRQWCKAMVGLQVRESPRAASFCDHAVRSDTTIVVNDASRDTRFCDNPLVTGPSQVAFYAGAPIRAGGEPIGALCVMDVEPRSMTAAEIAALEALARNVGRTLELRHRRSMDAAPQEPVVRALANAMPDLAAFDVVMGADPRPSWIYNSRSLRFLAVNDAAVEQYGWSREEMLGMTILDIRPAADAAILRGVIENASDTPYSHGRSWCHQRADGSTFQIQITGARVRIAEGPARLVIATDLTTRLSGERALVHAATRDSLTGLANRRFFWDIVSSALDDSSLSDLAVLFIDLDRFKLVNDTAGHAAGDAMLTAVAARIADSVRGIDTVARLGGDEFAIVCPGADVVAARGIAERVCAVLRKPFIIRDAEYHLSCSIGISTRSGASDADALLIEADLAMFAAKTAGRNEIVVFDQELRRRAAERSKTEQELHQALERDEFLLHYQPILDLRSNAVTFEALLRWQHPTKGLLLPGSFISVAEESGLILPIGRWVLEEAACAAARLLQHGDLARIAVNVSPRQFHDSLVEDVEAAMKRAGLEPRHLIIEVTESVLAETARAGSAIARLRAMGLGVSIDDFGTGYSSISRLQSFAIDALKLDRSFVHAVETREGASIAAAIVKLARGLRIPIVAEGVETDGQLAAIRSLGCRYVQGYHLARPMPEAAAAAFLRGYEGPPPGDVSVPNAHVRASEGA
jgi:diguanylate cyclase (GGDEF)-like protein/PAS domain S-box-containing protein